VALGKPTLQGASRNIVTMVLEAIGTRGGPTSIHGYSVEYPNILAKFWYLNVLYAIYNIYYC
jgi:hypothetical protein